MDELVHVDGGAQPCAAIHAYLSQCGMRCAGELDITTPRWAERPGMLVPFLLHHIRDFALNAAHRKFEQGRR